MTMNEVEAHHEAPKEAVEAVEVEAEEREVSQSTTAPDQDEMSDVEQEARALGWKSPDEWKGDVPRGYIDNPEDYMARLERSTPFRKMQERLEQANNQTTEKLDRVMAAMEAGHRRDLERQKADYERQMQLISAGQRRAAEEGDMERFDALEQQRRSVKAPEPEEFTPPQPQGDPLAGHMEARPWLNDPVMRQSAATAVDAAFRSGALPPNASVDEQVAYAEQRVKAYFPHMFNIEQKPQPKAKVDGGGLGARAKSGFDGLPSDAKAAFKRGVEQGIFEDTKEDREFYFNEYQG